MCPSPGETIVLKQHSRTEKASAKAKKAASSQKAVSKAINTASKKLVSQTSKKQILPKQQASKKLLPKRKILITSAIPYVNNIPHLGNIIGCVLSGDVYARYCRMKGYDTLYVCGTDEHGTATEAKAIEEGLTTQQICDKYHAIHKSIYEWFECSFDTFGRTTTKQHAETTQEIFRKLYKNGFILKDDLEQLYCTSCKTFLADRFVIGACPHCSYDQARGDQCDQCGKLLNAVELVQPRCKRCHAKPDVRTSSHLFLNLPKLEKPLRTWFERQSVDGAWPQNAVGITKAWFTEGLKPRCITRDLKWGVPVPLKGYENKVFYVWFDAPIGYISITQSARKDWKEWWKAGKKKGAGGSTAELVQFMAKDNIPFHSILFPASLIGAKEEYALVRHISSTEYLNYEKGKFSKTNKTGVFGDDAKTSGIPADVWRYYLLVNRPEQADTEFSWDDFQDKNNNELLANLGNFVNRTLTFLSNNFDGVVPARRLTQADQHFLNQFDAAVRKAGELLEGVHIKDALRSVMHAGKLANAYVQEQEPWKLVKANKERCGTVMNVCVNAVRSLAIAIAPFLPATSKAIFCQLNLSPFSFPSSSGGRLDWDSALHPLVPEGRRIGKPIPLFRKLEDEETRSLRERYSGKQQQQPIVGIGARQEKHGIFAAVDLRVAKIVSASLHPNADKLVVLQVDAGDDPGKHRQICAGIRKEYQNVNELVGKHIVLVKNLKPAKLRGELSEGMLLAAKDAQGKLAVLEAPDAPAGTVIKIAGVHPHPKPLVEFGEVEQLELILRHGKVMYQNSILQAAGKDVAVQGMREGTVG